MITVSARGNNFQPVARSFAFGPKLITGSTIKRHVTEGLGALPRFTIHESEHEDFAAARVLHDGGNQTLHFFEVNFHKDLQLQRTRRKTIPLQPSVEYSPRFKSPS